MLFTILNPLTKSHTLPIQLGILGIHHLQEPVQHPSGMPLFQWFFCVKGRGEIVIDNQRSILYPGQAMLIYPQISHSYHALTPDWTLHIFGFLGPACTDVLKALGMYKSGVYYLSDPYIFPEYIEKLYKIHLNSSGTKQSEFSKTCYDFLLDLSPSIHRINTAMPVKENPIVQKLISYMEENYTQTISLDDLAEHVSLSKEYMCSLFKSTMQQTIVHYLTGVRISRACILLGQYPEKKVLEIAHMCGFENPSYFGMIFKKHIGVTPEVFRRGMY